MSTTRTATASPVDLCTILTETRRIINAHSRHFLALSVLFLLPLSFSLTVHPILFHLLLSHYSTLNSKILLSFTKTSTFNNNNDDDGKALLFSLLFSLFVFTFSLFSIGSITYSVLHGFYGRPVKLVSAIRSAFSSFFPLLATVVFSQILVLLVISAIGFFLFLVFKGFQLLGIRFQVSSPYFTLFSVVLLMVVLLGLVYLLLKWSLACVLVVVEKSWGFLPLRRSGYLINGSKRVALSMLLFFAVLGGVLVFTSTISGMKLGITGSSEGWKSWLFVVEFVATSAFLTLLFLYSVAATTVLYMYCKAVHGELAWEIAEEFAREYVCLPFDDGKVPHVVSVVVSA